MLPQQPIKLSNSYKSLMKCGELFNKHFCKNKILLSPMRQQKFPIYTFPILSLWKYKLPWQPEFLSDRNKKHSFCRGQCPKQVCQVSVSSSLQFLRRRILIFFFFENLPFMSPRQPIKSRDLDKSRMKHEGLLNKHFCKKKISNIPNETAEIVNFHFSHYKSVETLSCHSNQSSYQTEIKKHNFCRR